MSPFLWALIANSIIALALIIIILLAKSFQKFLTKNIKELTALTVGVLFYLIFIEFIPELTHELEGIQAGGYLLLGILLFYTLELIFHWHHCSDLHHEHCCGNHDHSKSHEKTNLISVGTALHNLFHGIVLFSAFTISIPTGISLSIGIFLHALPQNIANFIMNHKKIKYVIIAALAGIFGVLIAYPFGNIITENTHIILAITAGGLLYLSLSDILPSIHGNAEVKEKAKYLILVLLGLALMKGFEIGIEKMDIETGHEEEIHIEENL